MPHVVFIAPLFLETTNRYVRGFAELEDVTVSVVSQDPAEAIPAELRPRITGHFRVTNCLDSAQLTHAVRAISVSIGRVDRLAGVLEQLQLPMAEVRDALGIEGLTTEIARNFRDKDRMKRVLRSHDVPVARSMLAHSRDDLAAFIDQVGFPVIVKPRAGLGSRATFRIETPDDLAALAPPDPETPIQVEEFVRAREHTCETITIRGTPVWRSGTRYFPSPLEVLETPWIQYSVLLPREDDDPTWTQFHSINGAALAALFGDRATTAAGTALTHMEWFLREDGSCLVNEVGARPPGVQIMPLMSLAHDLDMFASWARLMALDTFTPKPRTCAAGSAFFRGQGAGDRIVSVTGLDRAIEECGDALVEMRTPKVGQPRADGYEGEGFAIVKHATTDGTKRALRAVIENVQVRYG
ncbi:MAG: Formate-dependent phosphoribosylglycinamide formyltransferase [Myxococcales bacterium]|nr:Formate-dependent phosphoribosylglycinamide formyltransferase [Myxococcales bacterium]